MNASLVTVILARKKKKRFGLRRCWETSAGWWCLYIGNLDDMLRDVQPVGVMFNPTGQTAQLNHQPFSTWLSNSTKETDTPLG